jgi:hypothetical protein
MAFRHGMARSKNAGAQQFILKAGSRGGGDVIRA